MASLPAPTGREKRASMASIDRIAGSLIVISVIVDSQVLHHRLPVDCNR